ncbi:DinB family protein [soil metagenome]
MKEYLESRPEVDEYAPYFARYIARVETGDIVASLSRQGTDLSYFFTALSDETLCFRYAPGKWTIREVIGHLSDTERVMSYRLLCIARGDQSIFPGFDENSYVATGNFTQRSKDSLIAEFQVVRSATLALLESLDGFAWTRVGHANGALISVRALAWIIAGHADHHLEILRERYLQQPTHPL